MKYSKIITGQLICNRPGRIRLDYYNHPDDIFNDKNSLAKHRYVFKGKMMTINNNVIKGLNGLDFNFVRKVAPQVNYVFRCVRSVVRPRLKYSIPSGSFDTFPQSNDPNVVDNTLF